MSDTDATLLVVDDSTDALEIARRHLSAAGYRVYTACDGMRALELLGKVPIDLVITDVKMPVVDGLELVRHVRQNHCATEVMVVTAYATVPEAVTAVKIGANDYLRKPYSEDELLTAVSESLRRRRRRAPNGSNGGMTHVPKGMISQSPVMQGVFDMIAKAAGSDATVLIAGESGVGKELVAGAIHGQSARRTGPLVPVNCGAIPRDLFENQLFGHTKGAFTGASEAQAGFFQAADGGSLFLDEISELSLEVQVKLLRVLQDREVYMIGATRPRKVDVRIIAASGRDLASLVDEGRFRQDLYFRLSVLTIAVPPLRQRGDDIVVLARHYADKIALESGKAPPILSEEVLELFERHDWPGNVRELENLMQRLAIMAEGREVVATDLPASMRHSIGRFTGQVQRLSEAERVHIQNVLEHVGGNKTQAAKILGIDRKTLREKLKPH